MVQSSLHLAKQLGFQAFQFNMVVSHNMHAKQIYLKLGFKILGTVPQAVKMVDGTYKDSYIMYRNFEDLH